MSSNGSISTPASVARRDNTSRGAENGETRSAKKSSFHLTELKLNDLQKAPVPVPDRSEQCRIVADLNELCAEAAPFVSEMIDVARQRQDNRSDALFVFRNRLSGRSRAKWSKTPDLRSGGEMVASSRGGGFFWAKAHPQRKSPVSPSKMRGISSSFFSPLRYQSSALPTGSPHRIHD